QVLALAHLEVDVGQRVRLDFVGVEDLLDPLQLDEGAGLRLLGGGRVGAHGSGGRVWGSGKRSVGVPVLDSTFGRPGCCDYLCSLTRSASSKSLMSEMITRSPTWRPLRTSMVLTDARPSCTCTRTACLPSGSTRNRLIVPSGWP